MADGHIKYLTIPERSSCMKLGAVLACAGRGIRPEQLTKMAGIGDTASGIAKTVAVISLLAGVPLGTAAYMVSKQVANERNKERELKQKIQFYRDATQEMEEGLAASGTQVP